MITAATYDASAEAWLDGPDAVFDVLAAELVEGLSGRVLDVGCGTGTAARRLLASGASVVAVDTSPGMLGITRRLGCHAVVGDACRLPLRDGCAEGAVMGFVLNHLEEPSLALREVARVVVAGGVVRASTWARDDPRLVQSAVESVLVRHGWQPPEWYAAFKSAPARQSDTVELLSEAALEGGLAAVDVVARDVALPLSPSALVSWRLGLPHTAPWVGALDVARRASLVVEATEAVAAVAAPFVRVLLLTASP